MSNDLYRIANNIVDRGLDIFNSISEKICKVGNWAIENPQTAVSIISSVTLLIRASQSLVVSHRIQTENRRVDYTYYDRQSGHRWQLRRKLTNRDRAVIDRRKNNGDNMYDILSDLGAI